MASKLLNQKGQSTIEGALVATTCAVFVSVFMVTLYLLYASYWVEHIMYESLICQQERGRVQYCVSEAKDRINSTLLFKERFTIHMVAADPVSRVDVKMKIDPPFLSPRTFSFSKVLRI